MDSYTAWNGSFFMITWSIFKNHPCEVGLTQYQEIIALQNLTTIDLFYFIVCEDLAWMEIHWNSIWLRALSHMTSHYTWGHVTTLHDLGSVLGQLLDTYFGLSQLHGHGSWLMCQVALTTSECSEGNSFAQNFGSQLSKGHGPSSLTQCSSNYKTPSQCAPLSN